MVVLKVYFPQDIKILKIQDLTRILLAILQNMGSTELNEIGTHERGSSRGF